MPEAPVDEDGHTTRREDNVRLAPQALEREPMNAKAKALPMKMRSQCAFGLSVAPTLSKHPVACVNRRRLRGAT
jgi:hypothetical protein